MGVEFAGLSCADGSCLTLFSSINVSERFLKHYVPEHGVPEIGLNIVSQHGNR